jgi:hypothetical protein
VTQVSGIIGGDGRNRTADLLLAKQALSRLSHAPTYVPLDTNRDKSGGHRWTRTTDLTLIRRAL